MKSSRFFAMTSGVVTALLLGACGSPTVENASLLNQPLPAKTARLKIARAQEFAAMALDARVKIDGKEVASIGNGDSKVMDIPAGTHEVAVDNWQYPNVFKVKVDAKAGMLYVLQIAPRDEAVAASAFGGLAGSLVEAAANENGGIFQVRLVETKPARA